MFDNVAFNVVLGMVLVYLLYSLLATIVSEMLATWMGIRARLLRVSIERMLNDGFYLRKVRQRSVMDRLQGQVGEEKQVSDQGFWGQFFLHESPKFKESLAGKFYEYPSIKFLSKVEASQKVVFAQTKPSYITAENFATTLINMLADRGAGPTKVDQVRFNLRFNTLHVQPETLQHLRSLFNDAGNNIDTFQKKLQQWFDETQDRNNGWYKVKIRTLLFLFGLVVAIGFNVDSISIARVLATDKDARNQLANMGVALAKDSSRYKDFTRQQNDSARKESVLDTGLSRIQKDIHDAQAILGQGWDFSDQHKELSCKIDSSHKPAVYKAIKEKAWIFTQILRMDLSRRVVDSLAGLARESQNRIVRTRNERLALEFDTSVNHYTNAIPATSPKGARPDTVQKKRDSSTKRDSTAKRDSTSAEKINAKWQQLHSDSAVYRRDSFVYARVRQEFNQATQLIDSLLGGPFSSIVTVSAPDPETGEIVIKGQRPYYLYERALSILGQSFFSVKLIGFILTALALSLGSPFWFDLLNKLASIRGAGVKPEEKKGAAKPGGTGSDGGTSNNGGAGGPGGPGAAAVMGAAAPLAVVTPALGSSPPDATIEAGLKVYGDEMRAMEGVLLVHKGYYFTGNKANESLEVDVADEAVKAAVEKKYGALELFSHVVLQVIVTGDARTTGTANPTPTGNVQKGLANADELFGWGSFGCLMTNNDDATQQYIVSCYHVMNGDFVWNNKGTHRVIKNKQNMTMNGYQGALTSRIDAAFTGPITPRIRDFYAGFKPTGKRPVSAEDLLKKVKMAGFASSGEGVIVHPSLPATFKYPLGPSLVQPNPMIDLIAVSRINDDGSHVPFSMEGDSGALVVDEAGAAIGIIIGADLVRTYITRISAIEDQFNFSLDC